MTLLVVPDFMRCPIHSTDSVGQRHHSYWPNEVQSGIRVLYIDSSVVYRSAKTLAQSNLIGLHSKLHPGCMGLIASPLKMNDGKIEETFKGQNAARISSRASRQDCSLSGKCLVADGSGSELEHYRLVVMRTKRPYP